MKLPRCIHDRLEDFAVRTTIRRAPDELVAERQNSPMPLIKRWYVLRRKYLMNIYIHTICRSDEDRALHDHPWPNVTIVLMGGYWDHIIEAGGVHRRVWRAPGDVVFRRAGTAHRLELPEASSALTLFITGPKVRAWGFHCENGWRHWRDFGRRGCE